MSKPEKIIERGSLFIISYQLEGVCTALRLSVPNGLAPGGESLAMLKKLYADFAALATGSVLKNFPQLSENSNPADYLVFAETLRTSVLAFLTPDEISEHQKTIGFHADRHDILKVS